MTSLRLSHRSWKKESFKISFQALAENILKAAKAAAEARLSLHRPFCSIPAGWCFNPLAGPGLCSHRDALRKQRLSDVSDVDALLPTCLWKRLKLRFKEPGSGDSYLGISLVLGDEDGTVWYSLARRS